MSAESTLSEFLDLRSDILNGPCLEPTRQIVMCDEEGIPSAAAMVVEPALLRLYGAMYAFDIIFSAREDWPCTMTETWAAYLGHVGRPSMPAVMQFAIEYAGAMIVPHLQGTEAEYATWELAVNALSAAEDVATWDPSDAL